MFMTFKVDATGLVIPLAAHPALRDVSRAVTSVSIQAQLKEAFNRSVGLRADTEHRRQIVLTALREYFTSALQMACNDCMYNEQTALCTLHAVTICNVKARRPQPDNLDSFNFPVAFPSRPLFKKAASKWSEKDMVEICRWLEACSAVTQQRYLPEPTIAWANGIIVS